MKCQFCGQELPEGAKFCYNCDKQIACVACGKPLVDGAQICVFCGREIKSRTKNAEGNHIKFSESGSEKLFEASFSDETAGNVVSVFASLVPGLKLKTIPSPNTDTGLQGPTIVINDTAQSDNLEVNKIFREKDNVVYLVEKRLKGSSKIDQQARACLLFLLYYHENGLGEVSREAINSFMSREGLNDAHFRTWIAQNGAYFIRHEDQYELSNGGVDKAKEYLADVLDASIEQKWQSTTSSKPAKTEHSSTGKTKEPKSSQPKFLEDLNLAPEGKDSLESFMAKHKYRQSAMQLNLLFTYYLKLVLKIDGINQNHLFTCYKKLGLKVPNNLYHSISDTITKNRWLMSASNLNVTVAGQNEVEQIMRIK